MSPQGAVLSHTQKSTGHFLFHRRLEEVGERWRCRAAPRTPPPRLYGVPDEVHPKKKRLFGRAKRRHGRPPGSKGPTTISPPSAIALKDFSMLSVGVTAQSSMRDTVTCRYIFIRLFCCLSARFCCLSCETRRDLDEVARTSHTQPSLDPACLCGHTKKCLFGLTKNGLVR